MAKVCLLSSADPENPGRPYAFDELERMKTSAASDRFGHHSVTEDWDQADLVLFVENCGTFKHFFHEVRPHPAYRAHPDKCFMHTRTDYPVPFLPGVYASLRKRWYQPARVRSGMYLVVHDHAYVDYIPMNEEPEYLYSFIGKTNTHPVRKAIMGLRDDDAFLFDTTPFWPYGELPEAKRTELENQYDQVSRNSKFILCPRGYGTSSIRLFEALCMGRVPVVISDQWVPPEGPAWQDFSIRIPEKHVDRIPDILRQYQEQAVEMGAAARKAWENWFAREAIFHRVVEWCLSIQTSRPTSETVARWAVLRQLIYPRYLRMLAKVFLPKRV